MFEINDTTWRKLMSNPGKWKSDKSSKNVPEQKTYLDELPLVLATKSPEFSKFVLPQLNPTEVDTNDVKSIYQDREMTLKQEIIC